MIKVNITVKTNCSNIWNIQHYGSSCLYFDEGMVWVITYMQLVHERNINCQNGFLLINYIFVSVEVFVGHTSIASTKR